jgi:hypothetical protein
VFAWQRLRSDVSAKERNVSKTIAAALLATPLLVMPALAADQKGDPELAQFRASYTAGEGLAYVVVNDDKGEHIYRYGDGSRLSALKNPRGYMLFTCASPHVFLPERPEDKAQLLHATVVKAGDARFAELDGKYLADCHNPFVKSALPTKAQSAK